MKAPETSCNAYTSCLVYIVYMNLRELVWPQRFCSHFVRHQNLSPVNRNRHISHTLKTNIYTFKQLKFNRLYLGGSRTWKPDSCLVVSMH